MNKYVGKICPYCKSVFQEDDEVVICGDCDMPHHKGCWVEGKGCTTFGCQGTIQGIDFVNDNITGSVLKFDSTNRALRQNVEQPAFCSRCGFSLMADSAFCSKCGAPVRGVQQFAQKAYSQKANEVVSKISSELKTVMEDFKTNDYLDPELGRYIGRKSDYYLGQFTALKSQKKYNSWNWFAFLLSPFWCLYRKMYIPGAVILGVDFILALIGGRFSGILSIIIATLVGIFANYFYMYDLEQKMTMGKNLSEFQKSQYIKLHGDTSVIIPLVTAVIYVLICIILFV